MKTFMSGGGPGPPKRNAPERKPTPPGKKGK